MEGYLQAGPFRSARWQHHNSPFVVFNRGAAARLLQHLKHGLVVRHIGRNDGRAALQRHLQGLEALNDLVLQPTKGQHYGVVVRKVDGRTVFSHDSLEHFSKGAVRRKRIEAAPCDEDQRQASLAGSPE